jgi:hypothetical protein
MRKVYSDLDASLEPAMVAGIFWAIAINGGTLRSTLNRAGGSGGSGGGTAGAPHTAHRSNESRERATGAKARARHQHCCAHYSGRG